MAKVKGTVWTKPVVTFRYKKFPKGYYKVKINGSWFYRNFDTVAEMKAWFKKDKKFETQKFERIGG